MDWLLPPKFWPTIMRRNKHGSDCRRGMAWGNIVKILVGGL